MIRCNYKTQLMIAKKDHCIYSDEETPMWNNYMLKIFCMYMWNFCEVFMERTVLWSVYTACRDCCNVLLTNGGGDNVFSQFFFILIFLYSVLHCMLHGAWTNSCHMQRQAASSSGDVYVRFEQTIETLRDKLQQSDFELCLVSFYTWNEP